MPMFMFPSNRKKIDNVSPIVLRTKNLERCNFDIPMGDAIRGESNIFLDYGLHGIDKHFNFSS